VTRLIRVEPPTKYESGASGHHIYKSFNDPHRDSAYGTIHVNPRDTLEDYRATRIRNTAWIIQDNRLRYYILPVYSLILHLYFYLVHVLFLVYIC
jgi:hypothetical protein